MCDTALQLETKLGAFRLIPFVCEIAAIADHDLLAVGLRDCRHQGHDLAEIPIASMAAAAAIAAAAVALVTLYLKP